MILPGTMRSASVICRRLSGGATCVGLAAGRGAAQTRWTKDVSPEKALAGVSAAADGAGEVDESQRACGSTRFGRQAKEQPAKWDGEILVPFAVESALSGVKKPVRPDERLWYRRTFDVAGIGQRTAAAAALRRRRLAMHGVGQRQASRRAHGRLRSVHVRHHGRASTAGENEMVVAVCGSDRHRHAAARQASAQAARHLVHGGHRHLANGVAGAGAEAAHRVARRLCRTSIAAW